MIGIGLIGQVRNGHGNAAPGFPTWLAARPVAASVGVGVLGLVVTERSPASACPSAFCVAAHSGLRFVACVKADASG